MTASISRASIQSLLGFALSAIANGNVATTLAQQAAPSVAILEQKNDQELHSIIPMPTIRNDDRKFEDPDPELYRATIRAKVIKLRGPLLELQTQFGVIARSLRRSIACCPTPELLSTSVSLCAWIETLPPRIDQALREFDQFLSANVREAHKVGSIARTSACLIACGTWRDLCGHLRSLPCEPDPSITEAQRCISSALSLIDPILADIPNPTL